ncbi:hypothetical protein MUK42_03692 [Musa troglodytarum]|uniref:Uncharacterized protein n=1 Tax=Musa troglodytarum TaxID=320322 RepID=A0A9E7GW92_9LILI|nr:hypothetical protein MUK42_03692 [Musa troglodytarum]
MPNSHFLSTVKTSSCGWHMEPTAVWVAAAAGFEEGVLPKLKKKNRRRNSCGHRLVLIRMKLLPAARWFHSLPQRWLQQAVNS